MPNIPAEFMGVAKVRVPAFFGLLSRQKKIGIAIQRIGELRTRAADVVQFDAIVDLFVNPPTLYISLDGTFEINVSDGTVKSGSEETTDGTFFKLLGRLSDDRQAIVGIVDIHNFQLMGLAGTFLDAPIVLQAGGGFG
jgi:hypothetical protein